MIARYLDRHSRTYRIRHTFWREMTGLRHTRNSERLPLRATSIRRAMYFENSKDAMHFMSLRVTSQRDTDRDSDYIIRGLIREQR